MSVASETGVPLSDLLEIDGAYEAAQVLLQLRKEQRQHEVAVAQSQGR